MSATNNNNKKANGSSSSTLSAKRKTKKIQEKPKKLNGSLTKFGPAEVVLRSSSSPLAKVYETDEFKTEWDNSVNFHVARNLLHLRRFRKMSQSAVGKIMGTSQSAVARIESAQENITLATLERHIAALKGKFHVSIEPEEHKTHFPDLWWEVTQSGGPWSVKSPGTRPRGYSTGSTLGSGFRSSRTTSTSDGYDAKKI